MRKFPYLWNSSVSLEMVKAGRELLRVSRCSFRVLLRLLFALLRYFPGTVDVRPRANASYIVATVYTGQGAEYGGQDAHAKLIAAEDRARRRKIGMWSASAKSYESPSDYKKRTKA